MANYATMRKRGPNFTPQEKQFLLKLIKEREEIFDLKSLDSETLMKKNNAWVEVTDIFNVQSQVARKVGQLKHLYDNLKRLQRRNARKSMNCSKNEISIKEEIVIPDYSNDTATNGEESAFGEIEDAEFNNDPLISDPVSLSTNKTIIITPRQEQCKRQIKKLSLVQLKEMYFKRKIANEKLHRKLMVQQHNLQMRILRRQLAKYETNS